MSRPEIVCLCGSTRFAEAFRKANFDLTLQGVIVLSVGCDTKSDDGLGITAEQKTRLDELHLRKIDLADCVLVLNVDGYIGSSTKREIAYATAAGKEVTFFDALAGEKFLEDNAHELGAMAAGFVLERTRKDREDWSDLPSLPALLPADAPLGDGQARALTPSEAASMGAAIAETLVGVALRVARERVLQLWLAGNLPEIIAQQTGLDLGWIRQTIEAERSRARG